MHGLYFQLLNESQDYRARYDANKMPCLWTTLVDAKFAAGQKLNRPTPISWPGSFSAFEPQMHLQLALCVLKECHYSDYHMQSMCPI
jgi:hypothetical protein